MGVEKILGGDIGGTNSRLAIYEVDASQELKRGFKVQAITLFERRYVNYKWKSFYHVLEDFLKEATANGVKGSVCAGCIAVAGPVKGNKVTFTNRGDWDVDGDTLRSQFNIPQLKIVNDFVAQGYGLLTLDTETEARVLNKGKHIEGAPMACLGAGTGLGECFMTPGANGRYVVYPSEGGHAEYSPRNWNTMGLLMFLQTKFASKHRVSQERVVSGRGIYNIYEYLTASRPDDVNQEVHSIISSDLENAAKHISMNRDKCRLCSMSLQIFLSAYGSETGVVALKFMPFNGLYVTGGITPKVVDLISREGSEFMHAYYDKGRVSDFLHDIPVYAVLVEDLGERGALWVAAQYITSISSPQL